MKKLSSVFTDDMAHCMFPGSTSVERHHILHGTASRRLSEMYGLKVWLCGKHHNMSDAGVHFNKDLDLHLKKLAQEYYENNYGCRADFIETFGRNYLD